MDKHRLYSYHWDRPTFDDLVDGLDLRPTKLHLQVTARCSHACITCNHHVNPPRTDPLDTEAVIRLLGEGRALGATNLSLTGGEPLLRTDLTRILSTARDAGYDTITVATNGDQLAKKERARELLAAGATHVPISLHGVSTHDEIVAAPGSADRVRRAVDNLLDLTGGDGDRITVGMVAMSRTLDQLEGMVRFAADAGCGLRINVLDKSLSFFSTGTQTARLWPEDEGAIRRFVARCMELSTTPLLKLWPRNVVFIERYMLGEPILSPCPVGLEALYVSSDGQVFPGCWEKDSGHNVLSGKSLSEVWADSRFRELLHDAFCRRCRSCGCTFRTMSAYYPPYIVEGWRRTGSFTD